MSELTDDQRTALAARGFIWLPGLVDDNLLDDLRADFTASHAEAYERKYRLDLTRYPGFLRLLDEPKALNPPRSIIGDQLQLLECFTVFQPPRRLFGLDRGVVRTDRDWHRDFSYVVAAPSTPIMLTLLVYLDSVNTKCGPTVVLPGTHVNAESPVVQHSGEACPGEVSLPAAAGDAVLFNSALVHSRGRNSSTRPRRALVLTFGYWWMKQFDHDLPLPPTAVEGAPVERLRLLGVRQPGADLFVR